MESPDKINDIERLLTEYREGMASQRANTNLVYSWTGNILLILSTALLLYGNSAETAKAFYPIMVFAILLMVLWYGMTETFVFYIRQELIRINEIEELLGMKLMSGARDEIQAKGWKSKFVEARSYVRLFTLVYILIWIFMSWLKFRWI